MWWLVRLQLMGVQTLGILSILLFLFNWSMRIALIKLVRNKRKTCGAEVLCEFVDLLSKHDLVWVKSVVLVSDRALGVISQINCCSRIEKGQNYREDFFSSSPLYYL
jgi:hypothetical protein